MAENTDVVIIGGGAAGCSVAYYLSLAGVKATVIEREGPHNDRYAGGADYDGL